MQHTHTEHVAPNSIGVRYVALNLRPTPQALNPEGRLTACQPSPKDEKPVTIRWIQTMLREPKYLVLPGNFLYDSRI